MSDANDSSQPDNATAVRLNSSSSGQNTRERFSPGELLASRFRIIAPLGRGGMGEVYRADDVKLGQPVALKFLPATLERDQDRLQRLYGEVRLGRQVSHPNVCRLYDIVEWEGSHFISMEYIDGEDLGSLIRRIGKLPQEKALELTQDICAGLVAAHGLGVIHRDLKPANIMIDGRGRARITDFGLAGMETELAGRREVTGTPAYMAPEQLRGEPATVRSDIYALGLIMFEMFSGKRYVPSKPTASSSASADRTHSHDAASTETKDLDPAVQRIIIRCLAPQAESRPPSIHAVIAALPGGDPLQAMLDAGETPSPEMVAAAGVSGELKPALAISLGVLAVALILGGVALKERSSVYSLVRMPLKPDALEQRARDVSASLGYLTPRYTSTLFIGDVDYVDDWRKRKTPPFAEVAVIRPSPILFSYRESPREMMASRSDGLEGLPDDPPFTIPGMVRIRLDTDGRLTQFAAVPPARSAAGDERAIDWSQPLRAAGLSLASLKEVPAEWSAPVDTDRKIAWVGAYADQPAIPLRIEAASFRGKVVYFSVIPHWRKPAEPAGPAPTALARWTGILIATLGVVLVAGAAFLARRNFRRGRADRAGALQLAAFLGVMSLVASLFRMGHSTNFNDEFNAVFASGISFALIEAALTYILYLALEPYLRRRWPKTLVGWSRLVAGRVSDPMVGRDLLVGTIAGGVVLIISAIVKLMFGEPTMFYISTLGQTRYTPFLVMASVQDAGSAALFTGVLLLLSHLLVRHRAVAIALTILLRALPVPSIATDPYIEVAQRIVVAAIIVAVFVRFGVLAAAAMSFVTLLWQAPVTLNPSNWLFGRSLIALSCVLLIVAWGFYRALGTQPLFAAAVLDD